MKTIALLRAVNVGGTGKLPMAELKAMAEELGFKAVRTYIASGNLLFDAGGLSESAVKAKLEKRLADYAGKPVGVMVRSGVQMAQVAKDNPFAREPGNRVVAMFLDEAPPESALTDNKNLADERIAIGRREIYVHYPEGQGPSRLIIPAAKAGTARNINTVMRLVELAGE